MAAPKAPHAIPKRAESRQLNGAPKPDRFGKILLLGTLTFSKINSPVDDALKDSFPCISGVEKPSIPLSTINPCILPDSSFAQTTAMCANGALEIHILAPFRITWSPSSLKLESIPPGFEPKSGSVKPKQPIISPVASLGKNRNFCSSEPYFQIGYITNED